jgi:hypothetical protein
MFGRRSLSLPIFLYDPNLERISKRSRSKRNSHLRVHSKSAMMKNQSLCCWGITMFPRHTHLLQAFSCRTLRQLILKLSPDSFKCSYYFTNLVPRTLISIDEFIEICSTIRLQNFSDDALRMRLFLFFLKDKAKYWLNSLESNSITYWAQMQHEFLEKYFTIGKTNQIQKAITSFS